MNDNSYLLLITNGDLKPLRGQFKKMDAIYTGIGYAFPEQQESLLRQLVSSLPGSRILRYPLGERQTFESFRQSHKVSFFRDKIHEVEKQILIAQAVHHLDEFTENAIHCANLDGQQKSTLLELVEEKEKLKEMMEWAEGMEKALSADPGRSNAIQFINERPVNFLTTDAEEMPRLVNYIDGGRGKPLIRKGIVGQLVGAGGVGKTHALAQLAISVATGTNWLEIYPIEKAGYVFMGLGENADEDIHRLLRKIIKSIHTSPHSATASEATFFSKDPLIEAAKRLAVMSFTGMDSAFIHQNQPTAFFETFLQKLKEKEPEEGWSLIILDPISRFLGSDAETDNAAATRFISLLERLTLEIKGRPTVLFGHHMNKTGGNSNNTDQGAARGSSAITDGVRWQANLEKAKKDAADHEEQYELNKIIMRSVKSNFTAILPAQLLEKDENGCLRASQEKYGKVIATSQDQKRRIREK
jgi:hypothetical protein